MNKAKHKQSTGLVIVERKHLEDMVESTLLAMTSLNMFCTMQNMQEAVSACFTLEYGGEPYEAIGIPLQHALINERLNYLMSKDVQMIRSARFSKGIRRETLYFSRDTVIELTKLATINL